ncbi:Hypothetical predicted protein [Mytilus galloprovincialis]|uniref:Uncharacterized protein n=1 Tax=Mytilus galloprovincialis TaxID=29158 RepID=A0A8B6HQT0_MYTGA|nr:Hypothetical predicted protein [Mytilus galloprovincialis]
MFKNKLLKCEIDGDDLNILQTYDAPTGTYYLDAFNDQLVACCSGAFKILDFDGKEVQSFKRSGFETPIAVSTKQKRFYHKTDNSEVIGRKLSDGNEVFNFKDDSLSSVSGIALDCQDNVYATGFSSKNLVQISKNRRKHRVLVEKFNKVTKPATVEKRRRRRQRRWWTRPWLSPERRRSFGLYDQLMTKLRREDRQSFLHFLRMPTEMFDEILQRVGPRIAKQNTFYKNPLEP